jgi:hypothetical protein
MRLQKGLLGCEMHSFIILLCGLTGGWFTEYSMSNTFVNEQ